jgi:hypothetical protein
MFYEALETRTLMSADPNTAVNASVMTDRVKIHADLMRFRSDGLAFAADITSDVVSLEADGVQNDTTLMPLFTTLVHDVKSMRSSLKADLMTEASNVAKDEKVILAGVHQFKDDKGHHGEQKTDRSAIITARIQLQNDEVDGLSARVSTRESAYTKIFADFTAIGTAAATDTSASDQLKSDVQTFVTDATNGLNTMDSDLHRLINDRKQLVVDLTAIQSQT